MPSLYQGGLWTFDEALVSAAELAPPVKPSEPSFTDESFELIASDISSELAVEGLVRITLVTERVDPTRRIYASRPPLAGDCYNEAFVREFTPKKGGLLLTRDIVVSDDANLPGHVEIQDDEVHITLPPENDETNTFYYAIPYKQADVILALIASLENRR